MLADGSNRGWRKFIEIFVKEIGEDDKPTIPCHYVNVPVQCQCLNMNVLGIYWNPLNHLLKLYKKNEGQKQV